MKPAISIVFFLSISLTGCNKSFEITNTHNIDELTEFFYQNQAHFDDLSSTACSYFSRISIGFKRFKVDEPVIYPEHLAANALKMNFLLKKINKSEVILHQTNKVECSLFIKHKMLWQSEGGSHIGYSYQPPNLNPYDPAIHQFSANNTQKRIHFTKSLEDGWYIEYLNIP